MSRNPFTPSFGVSPPELVGRDDLLHDFADALEEGVGSPMRALIVTGLRGSGKTVLLNALEDQARAQKWRVISVTAHQGVLDELTRSRMPEHLSEELGEEKASSLSGFSAGALGFSVGLSRETQSPQVAPEPDLRAQLTALAQAAAEREAGVLLSIDEVHRNATDDLRVITQVIQHAFREGLEVAMIAAGLPQAVSDLLSTDVVTFLRRAERHTMEAVNLADVRRALHLPIEKSDKQITPEALDHAAQGTQGYPYLIQSVGYEMWRYARHSEQITLNQAEDGVEAAIRRIGRLVHEPSLASLSPTDKSFLAAMAADQSPSRMGNIATRLGATSGYASVYRNRLIAAGLIHSSSYGYVDFALPYLRDYLTEHVATHTFDSPER